MGRNAIAAAAAIAAAFTFTACEPAAPKIIEKMVERPGWTIKVIEVRIEKVDVSDDFLFAAWNHYTDEIKADSIVSAYVDLSSGGEKWFPLPFSYPTGNGSVGYVNFGYTTGIFSLQFDATTRDSLVAITRLYQYRYVLRIVIETPGAPAGGKSVAGSMTNLSGWRAAYRTPADSGKPAIGSIP